MRGLTFLIALAALPSTPVAAAEPDRAPAAKTPLDCENAGLQKVDKASSLMVRPLRDESPAKHLYGVVRKVDGCEKPIVIRENVK